MKEKKKRVGEKDSLLWVVTEVEFKKWLGSMEPVGGEGEEFDEPPHICKKAPKGNWVNL